MPECEDGVYFKTHVHAINHWTLLSHVGTIGVTMPVGILWQLGCKTSKLFTGSTIVQQLPPQGSTYIFELGDHCLRQIWFLIDADQKPKGQIVQTEPHVLSSTDTIHIAGCLLEYNDLLV